MNAKIGRNDACSCGSGLKYKKCCGKSDGNSVPAAAVRPALPELLKLLQAGQHAELERATRGLIAEQPGVAAHWKLLAAALHGQGRDALEALEEAARLSPRDAESHSNLGNVLRARGNLDAAAAAHRRALAIDPKYAKAHSNLGSVLRDQGQLQAAAAAFKEAVRLDPDFALAQNNLGIVLRELGSQEDAIRAHRRALALAPDLHDAHSQLGRSLQALGRTQEAIASYRRALVMQPEHLETLLLMAGALQAMGQAEQAALYFRRFLVLRPDSAEVRANLGNALREAGQPAAARDVFLEAVALRPDSAEMHNNLGNALMDLGDYEAAATSYRAALERNPNHVKAHSNLGSALREIGHGDEALAEASQALMLDPDSPEMLTNLASIQRVLGHDAAAEGNLRRALELDPGATLARVTLAEITVDGGNFERAEALYREAFALDGNSASAWAGVAATRRMTVADAPWLAQAEDLIARPRRARDAAALWFAMGKFLDDVGDYDRAFAHYRQANEAAKAYHRPHDPLQLQERVNRLCSRVDAAWITSAQAAQNASMLRHRPIFVAGMPRSGTSLAEQILASHPAVFGAGELPFWTTAWSRLESIDPEVAPTPALTASLATEYDALLDGLNPGKQYAVDKMPANFFNLGLICAAIPGARIIHMTRNPVDTCLSIYFQNFHVGHPYSTDLEHLAHYYEQYRRMMAHWQRELPPGTILEVPYEGLVSEPELYSRRMIEFTGLQWSDACLEFQQTQRQVRTFSRWQVRQKINSGSVQRWKRYAAHITPLLRLDAAPA